MIILLSIEIRAVWLSIASRLIIDLGFKRFVT